MSDQPTFAHTRIGHIVLGTTSIERSIAFYRDTLGLPLLGLHGGLAFFNGGGVTLMLSTELARAAPNLTGATEVVFTVDSVQAAYDMLLARGVAFLREPRPVTPTDWAANFPDPDGHLLSLYGPK